MKQLHLTEQDVEDLITCIEVCYSEGQGIVRPAVLEQLGITKEKREWLWEGAERYERELQEESEGEEA